jgi:HEAT repeat protein
MGQVRVEYEAAEELEEYLRSSLIPPLIQATNDPDASVREAATKALGDHWNSAHLTIDTIIEMTRDPSDHVRLTALRALDRFSFTKLLLTRFERVQQLLGDSNVEILLQATKALIAICQMNVAYELDAAARRKLKRDKQAFQKRMIPALQTCISESDLACRAMAVRALIAIVPYVEEFTTLMESILHQETAVEIKDSIIRWLGKSNVKPNPSIPLFIDSLSSLPIQALHALEACGTDVAPYIPKLFPLLRDSRWEVRYHTLLVLKAIGPDAEGKIVPVVATMLKDREFTIREEVANVLKAMQSETDGGDKAVRKPNRRRENSATKER